MTVEQLEEACANAKARGDSGVVLVFNRKRPPSGYRVRLNGMGLGEIYNVQMEQDERSFRVVARFELADVDRYCKLIRAFHAAKERA